MRSSSCLTSSPKSFERLGVFARLGVVAFFVVLITCPAFAQTATPSATIPSNTPASTTADPTAAPTSVTTTPSPSEFLTPLDQLSNDPQLTPMVIVQDAAKAVLPGFEGGVSSTLNIVILLTVLTLAPSILILCTSFTRIIIVLALLRQAMGTQALPPSQVITGLALFMTILVMTPAAQSIHRDSIVPLSNGQIDQMTAWSRAKQPLRDFMFAQIERADHWSDVYLILNYRGIDTSREAGLVYDDVDMVSLIPAYILSELKTAFLIGFRIYLPFLILDMVIASLLISMGMMMLPPVLISLPFKLLLFVMVDGWGLIVGNLLEGFATGVVN